MGTKKKNILGLVEPGATPLPPAKMSLNADMLDFFKDVYDNSRKNLVKFILAAYEGQDIPQDVLDHVKLIEKNTEYDMNILYGWVEGLRNQSIAIRFG